MTLRRPIYSLLGGMALAAVAVFVLYNWRTPSPENTATAPVPATVTLPVAAVDIPFGAKIQPEMIREAAWPANAVPQGAVTTTASLLESTAGPRIAIRSFVAGEPFLRAKISGFGEKPTLSRRVPSKMRAYTIQISDVSGVAGFLLPGDHVDVVLARQISGAQSPSVADVILQDVTVLGIDQLANEQASDPVIARTATIEVMPEDAQRLALAAQLGSLSLALRNYADNAQEASRQVSVENLIGRRGAPEAGQPARAVHNAPGHQTSTPHQILVRRGTEAHLQTVSP